MYVPQTPNNVIFIIDFIYSFGTGTNGAYVEDAAKINKLGNSISTVQGSKMVVNTEWGAFDNQVYKCQSLTCGGF